jgi:hypothetical protein
MVTIVGRILASSTLLASLTTVKTKRVLVCWL